MRNRARSISAYWMAPVAIALSVGCSKNNNNRGPGPGGGTGGSGNVTTATSVANNPDPANGFSLPLDAAPSPDGNTIYFTGVQSSSSGAALFKVAATGGAVTPLVSGGDLGSPLAIAVSSDGSTLYAADPAYSTNTSNDSGAIFSVSTGGGAATPLAETLDYAPRSLAVARVGGSDNLYFIGSDKADGASGIFKDAAGAVTTVLKSGEPQAIAASSDGTVYFLDNSGTVQKIAAGGNTATPLGGGATNLAVSFPAGLEVSQDGKFVLVPVADAKSGHQGIARIDASTGAVTPASLSLPATNGEAGGFHRAANADVYSFVDSGAGTTGTVYLVK